MRQHLWEGLLPHSGEAPGIQTTFRSFTAGLSSGRCGPPGKTSFPTSHPVEKVLAKKTPAFACRAARPRASATPEITKDTVRGIASAEAGTVGRRRRRVQLVVDGVRRLCPLLVLQLRLSRPPDQQNARWARFSVALPPGTPTGCLAGHPAEKSPAFACRAAPGPDRGGGGSRDPTGRNCSAYRPLMNHQQRKFSPSPTPLEAVQTPGWSAQRHRQGRRCKASRQVQPQARPRSPHDGRRHPRRKAGAARHSKTGVCSDKPAGVDRKTTPLPPNSAPRSLSARLGDSFYFAECEIVESLLRRGARGELSRRAGTALKPHRLPTKAKKTPAKHPTGAPGGRCLPALGMGHSSKKTFFGRAPGKFFRFNSS